MIEPPLKLSGRISAGFVVSLLFAFAIGSTKIIEKPNDIEKRFVFERYVLPITSDKNLASIRNVHPDYSEIDGWISAVGSSIAFGNLDNDDLYNEICHVDPRNDTVVVMPSPDQPDRFAPFELNYHIDSRFSEDSVAPMGCFFADIDADGNEDIVVYFWGRPPIIFHNNGSVDINSFAPVPLIADDEVWFTNAANFSDLDGDGRGDLIFGNYFPDESGVLDVTGKRPVEMQHSMSRARNAGRNRLFINRSLDTIEFADLSSSLSVTGQNSWTLAIGTADLNDDGFPEIYFANDFGPDQLLLNTTSNRKLDFKPLVGQRGLTDLRSGIVGKDSFKGMGVEFADINSDGEFDIHVSNIAENYALHESHFMFVRNPEKGFSEGFAPFQNKSGQLGIARSGWSWDAKFGDFDNDGVLELVQATGFLKGEINRWPELQELATGNDELLKLPGVWPRFSEGADLSGRTSDAFFVKNANGRYLNISSSIGLGEASVSRGIGLSDVDGDGDMDFAIARQWEPSLFFRNNSEADNQALILDLRLQNKNGTSRPAIGATIRVTDADGKDRIFAVDSSNGHSGGRSPEIHIGLGNSKEAIALEVSWRDERGYHSSNLLLAPGRHRVILKAERSVALLSLGKRK